MVLCLLCMTSLVAQGQKKSGGPVYVEGPQIKVDVRHLKWSDFEGIQPRRTALTRGDETPSRWIDRIGNMPDYLIDFYQLYGTTVQEVMDGQENWLSNPEKAEVDPYSGAYYVTVKTIKGSTDFTFSAGSSNAVIQEAAGNAVQEKCGNIMNEYTCFMNYLTLCMNYDYPEAFWTGNAANWSSGWEYGYNYSSSAGTGTANYTLTLTFVLKGNDFDYRIPEFRDPTTLSSAVTEFKTKVNSITESYKSKTRYEQVSGLNDWLTKHNSYNSDLLQTGTAADIAWSSMSALRESTGALGPVCEGYARAFKCLCDKLSIPCILANGNAKSSKSGTGEAHMWNEVQMENNNWYAVDVTWNDPIMYGADNNQKVSGGESQFWLLLGKDDEVSPGFTFEQSHPNTPAGDNPNQSQWEILFTSLIADHGYETGVTPPPTESVRTFNNVTAGSLPTLISDAEKYTIEELAITGELNGTDFRLIREMAGNDYLGQPTNGVLKKLDISGANIVEGGDMYLDAQNMQIGSSTWSGSDYHKSTNDNILGAFLFAGCKALEEIKLPSTITTIEYNAFWYCTSLKGLEIPKSVRGIYSSAISDCTSLESLVVESGNSNYKSDNCNAVISGTTLLIGCKNTVIPDYITEIGNNAFFGCSGFKGNNGTLTLPIGLKSISAYGFADCSFSSIVLPNGLEKIDYSAFARNHALTAITIPASVTYIGRSILEDCTNLNSIVIADGNTVYDSRDNCNAIIETATNKLIEGFENTVIPTTVTTIGEDAYYQCLLLKEVTIPEHITSIEQRAYWNCQNLKDVYCYIKVPFAITTDVFWNLPNTAVLHVPSGTKPLYEATDGWKDVFSGRIYEINSTDPVAPVVLNVATAGTLPTLISDAEKYSIKELTITGNLNGTDFRLIREMAGNDYLGQPTNGVLKKLDISGANIVEGGEKYLDADNVYSSTGTYTHMGGDFFHFGTQNNVLGHSIFAGCDKLEEVVLPNSITSIGDYVFWFCLKLKALEIPENVSSIGRDFVFGPNQLSKLTVVEGNMTYSSPTNSNALMQGSKLVFGISSTQIPTGTTVIGSNAFEDCNPLGDVTLPEGVTTIEVGAFAWSGLTSINMPSTLTTIGNDAFAGCNGLTSFTLPKSVVSYGDGSEGGLGALKDCHNLTSIQVEDGNPNYDSRNDCNAIIETATNTLVSGCQTTVIPNTVTILGNQAFRGASLSDFVIPDWITHIGERAFWDSSLSSVKIPGSVASIGRFAFTWCNNLTTVTIENKVPLAIEENTFSNRANIDLIVPVGSVGLYKVANYWKDFKSIKDTEGNTEPAATPISLTLNVETAGTLPTLISEIDRYLTTELTLTGNLNGTDFRLIREMAGNDYLGQPTNGVLKKLDISGATIVEGGEMYVDADEVWSSHGSYAHWGGDYFHFNTQQNVLGNAMFAGCEKLVEIVLPKSITSIGNLAFFDCMNLESLVIPDNVSSIGEDVFVECNKLSGVSVAEGNQTFSAPANCNVLMEGTTLRIAFANPVIPEGTTAIGANAFRSYYGNADFVVPEGVVSIGNNAFGWSNIKSISLPSTLKRIESFAFQLTQLESITIPASVEFIGMRILNHCSNLTTITVASDNPTFDSRDHCNAIIETATNTLIQGCKTTVIPESVTALGETAFTECYNLKSITIPKSITQIGDATFMFCADLKDIYSFIEEPFNVSASAFSEIGVNTGYTTTLHVPYGTKEAYLKAEGWKEFKDFIVEMVATDKVIYTPNEEEKTVTVDGSDETAKVVEISPVVEIDGEKYEVTAIGEGAFENNENLEKVSIPETIEFIGDNAFAGCTGLKEIRVFAEEPIQLGSASAGTRGDDASSVFAGVDTETCTLYVPYGSKEKYENADGWSEFKNIVEMGGPETIKISGAKQVTYMSDKDLDFTGYPDLKAYVATGYDKASGTIWLTRVKEIPANTGFLLMGEANTYEIPVKAGGLSAYYQNMFKGTIEGTTIQTTEGDNTNYYLSDGESGVGFYKVQGSVTLKANRAYLSVPTEIPAVGTAGSTETIKVSAAGQVPYYNSQSLDFSSLDAQGVKAYTATGYDYTSGTIWLTRVKQVPAETGILIMAPQGEYPVPTASVASVYANMFKGTLTGTTIQTHETIAGEDYINYYLSSGDAGVGFYKVTKEEGVTIGANRCYLPIKNKEVAGTRSAGSGQNQIAFEEADEVIGIQLLRGIGDDNGGTTNLTPALSKGEGEWYTLQGQRVAKPAKGLYIRNGKKVVIK